MFLCFKDFIIRLWFKYCHIFTCEHFKLDGLIEAYAICCIHALKETSITINLYDQVQVASLTQNRNKILLKELKNKIYNILKIDLEANNMEI